MQESPGQRTHSSEDRIEAIKIDDVRDLILAAVNAIPAGSIASYGVVGERAGLHRQARLVARVLSDLPVGHSFPWFRVVRSGGRIAFQPGGEDFLRQRRLLEGEGCKVSHTGLVTPALRAPTLDALMWGPMFDPDE